MKMRMKRNRLIIGVILAAALAIVPASGAFAATSDTVLVTATPSFIGITVAPDTYEIGGAGVKILKATTYYANPLGATTPPSATVADGECDFTITNTSSVITNITVNFPDFASGDAMTNSDLGYLANGANAFGVSGYVSGLAWPGGAVILKKAASTALISALGATTNKKFGWALLTKSADWTGGTAMTSTVVITATPA